MNTFISSQEVASLLQVTETTIKRWSNNGALLCHKTLGGHRKFELNDLLQFAEKENIKISGVLPANSTTQFEGLEYAIAAKNYNTISNFVLEKALQSNTESLSSLFLYLAKHHIAFPTVADEIIRPALVRIGDLWSKGKLEIHQEHRATHSINDALVRFYPQLYRKPKHNYVAVCACPENELHEIGIRSIAYTLETEGWTAHFLGANTPLNSLEKSIREIKPQLVCLSFTLVKSKKQFLNEMQSLGKILKKMKIKFVVGGFYAGMFSEQELGCDHILLSAHDIVSYSKDEFQLKTGPKTKTK